MDVSHDEFTNGPVTVLGCQVKRCPTIFVRRVPLKPPRFRVNVSRVLGLHSLEDQLANVQVAVLGCPVKRGLAIPVLRVAPQRMFQAVNDEATNIQVPTFRCAMDGRCAEGVGGILVCNLVLLKGLDDGAAHLQMSFAGRQMERGVA